MAWVALQFIDVLGETWDWPMLVQQVASLILGLGLFPALVVAWYHGEKGRQRVCRLEAALVSALILGSVVAVWSFCFGLTTR